jgi:penicillin amidase
MKPNIDIWRDEHGVAHVRAAREPDLYWGQGVVHATDRAMQMLVMRILGQGRLSELLDSSDASLDVDIFFRRMNWRGDAQPEVDKLTPAASEHLEHYCDGVNSVLEKKYPWEFKLLGYRPEPWRPEDTIMIARMLGYVTLQQSQAAMERLFVEMVQAGTSEDRLEELFPGLLGGLDIELLNKVKLNERVVPLEVFRQAGATRMMASNNWVIAGAKTASGKPLLANDPHLEGNRLPNVWCEIALHMADRYIIGGSMPGGPSVIVGRTPDVAWGATYAFMDAVDSWIERCKDGKYFREPDQWTAFDERREIIERKKKEPAEITFYENEHGILDGDPYQEGYYLATRWAAGRSGATTLCQMLKMWDVKTVEEAMDTMGRVETAWNLVFADRNGNIGYQMSGLMPKRRPGVSGLVPLPGWKKENDWEGFVSPEDLPRVFNPAEGYFATANQDLNQYGKVNPINLPMGPYRAERINDLLREGTGLASQDMFRMHFDVYSPQAERFMEILRPLLPNTPQGDVLQAWDLRYSADSKGAHLFEAFYQRLYEEVFGEGGLGRDIVKFLAEQTGIFIGFYLNFDRVMLSEKSGWFRGEGRENLYRRVAADALAVEPRPWGQSRRYMLRHLLFGGKLPAVLGFDRGPVTAIGGRATIHQGQLYRTAGRLTTFVPSFRFVADMATDDYHSNLEGGPSDRRFSRWYCSDLKNWLTGKYKKVPVDTTGKKLRFK